MSELYDRLGLKSTATAEEIKSAYRSRVKDCHPDLHPDDSDKLKKFIHFTEAYEVLNDLDRRKAYDETGFISQSDETERLRTEALDKVAAIFNLLAPGIENPATQDLVLLMKRRCQDELNTLQQEIPEFDTQEKTYMEIARRLSKTGEPSKLLADILIEKIKSARRNRQENLRNQQVITAAFQIISEYTYIVDTPATQGYVNPLTGFVPTKNFTTGSFK